MQQGIRCASGVRFVVIVAILLSFCACISAPVQEMSNARQAIAAATEAGAHQTAPQLMQQAQRLLDRAELSLNEKLFRDARRSAIAAKNEAVRALQTTDDR